jgi:hypothetical protein
MYLNVVWPEIELYETDREAMFVTPVQSQITAKQYKDNN